MVRAVVILLAFASEAAAQAAKVAEFTELFEWVRSIELQQTENAVVSRPRLTRDIHGGWLVLDSQSAQVLLHGNDGRLRAYFGRKGNGPGEFTSLAAVLRAPSGELITVDMSGRFARWSADGSRLLVEFRLPLLGISAAEWIGPERILVLTPPRFARGSKATVLHVIDLHTRAILHSFYEPEIPANARNAWVTFLGGGIATNGRVLAVTLPLLDSLLLLSNGIGQPASIPLGIHRDPTGFPDGRLDREAFKKWASQIQVVGPVYVVPEGWLIPLVRVGPDFDRADLLFLRRTGERPLLVRQAPIIIGTDQAAGEVIFDSVEHLEPQYLRIARMRAGNY